MLLENKRLVIIGGTSGMGLSAAKAFIAEGAQVLALGAMYKPTLQMFRRNWALIQKVLFGDATQENTASMAIEECIAAFGGFDGLYHVAGGSGRKMGDGPLHLMSLEGWQKTLELNLTSVMLSNQAAVRQFLESGRGGSILNMGSVLDFLHHHNILAPMLTLRQKLPLQVSANRSPPITPKTISA